MLKKTIKYVDYDGNEREEDFYFNLTKAEVVEMNFEEAGGLDKYIQKIIQEQDRSRLIMIFKEIIIRSYGVKSLDGKRFVKNDQVRDEFMQNPAYSELFMELATDADKALEFIKGISPVDIDSPIIAAPKELHTV